MPKSIVSSPKVALLPGALYSQATRAGNLLFIAGMVPRDEKSQLVGPGDIRVQTRQVLENIKAIVEAAGGTMLDILKLTIFLTDMANFEGMNDIYREYFKTEIPARTTVKADLVRKEYLIEIEAVASIG